MDQTTFDLLEGSKSPASSRKDFSDMLGLALSIVLPVSSLLCLPMARRGGNERRFLRRGDQIGGGSHFLIVLLSGFSSKWDGILNQDTAVRELA